MRIAQVAPLWEPVPPHTYGGTELVVSLLTEHLVQRGHDVTLFAAGDSATLAHLNPGIERGFREMMSEVEIEHAAENITALELGMLGRAFAQADEFDVIHNHLGALALPFANLVDTPVVSTIHNAGHPRFVRDLFAQYGHLPYISISNYQRKLWPDLSFSATIYHGIELDKFHPRFDVEQDAYLAFLGRMCPAKGAHLAIQMAQAVGRPLVLAGKIDEEERQYFEKDLAPHIDGTRIRFIGEVDHEQKAQLLRNAAATLFPIQWPEPFGLVMVESLACGTPVLALRNGSVPEILEHGISGFIGESAEDLIEDLADLDEVSRHTCRREAAERFSVERMVDDHELLYRRLLLEQSSKELHSDQLAGISQSASTGDADHGLRGLEVKSPIKGR